MEKVLLKVTVKEWKTKFARVFIYRATRGR